MNVGKITAIYSIKKLFTFKFEDEYVIAEYYNDKDISVNDMIMTGNILGDVFIKNETTGAYFQAKIRYIGINEKKMKKILESL